MLAVLGAMVAGPGASVVSAADGPQMEAHALLQGHARLGSWIAIEVRLQNDGAPIVGELQLQGGSQGGTRFSTPVDLPSPADKTFLLYAQPPSFGSQLDVLLSVDKKVVVRQKVPFTIHDPTQMTVGVVAAQPQGVVANLQLPGGGQNNLPPIVVQLQPGDLPERIEAWSAIDRLIWQDVDTNTLSSRQIAALRGWLALGGRLVIVGGTAGPGVMSGFPDEILPYRPATTLDVAPASLAGLLGSLPDNATDVPALAGELERGRALASSGDRVIAADVAYGSGSVTVVGVDPTAGWIADSKAAIGLWRGLIPPRSGATVGGSDDSQIVGAVSELPVLALPPIGGLLLLLFGYIALIGPINYLVLRRLDRREWAWITMPALIAVFAVGAYAFGSALRGSDVIVNEVAIVRGAPDATEGMAQSYLGVFSPTRGTYHVTVRGGALLSAPVVGDFFGGQGTLLDVVQGEPAEVRDLSVGFGSLRTVRAETAVEVPKVHVELRLVDGQLVGSIRNNSKRTLESPAVVLGSSTVTLQDLAPGQSRDVALRISPNQFGASLSDRLFGQVFFETAANNDKSRRNAIRHRIVDQLTYDPMFGTTQGLPSDVPVVLTWGRDTILDVDVAGQKPARTANVLYYIPASMTVSGKTAFRSDLIRSTVVSSDANFFSKDPMNISFGKGTVTMAYRPIPFDGTFTVSKVLLQAGFGGDLIAGGGKPIEPAPTPKPRPSATCDGANCGSPAPEPSPGPNDLQGFDGMPEVELLDLESGAWVRLPHLGQSQTYDLKNPARYVDPGSGTLQVRFVNDRSDGIGFAFNVSLEGTVR
jgi:hypothetical protein